MGGIMNFLPIIIMFALFMLNVPIAFSLIAAILPYFLFVNNTVPMHLLMQRVVSSAESSSLLAIPFFVLAGSIMTYGGLSKRMMDFAEALVGHKHGSLAKVMVLLSVFMGGVSGSSAADASLSCKMIVPEMERRGYDKTFGASVAASASLITPIIPPGIGLIMYACLANCSVGKMFAAGYIPGLLMAVGMLILVDILAKKRGYLPARSTRAPAKEVWKTFLTAIWGLLLPFGLILLLRLGIFTATEGGAFCVVYSFLVGKFVYKEFKREHFFRVLKESAVGTASIMFMICAANAFAWYMSYENIPGRISAALLSLNLNSYTFLLICMVIFLIMGMFIDGSANMIILTPILLPTALSFGIDVIQFGLLIVLNTVIGMITPPFGLMLFLTASLVEVRVVDIVKAIWPFLIFFIAMLFLFTYVPVLSTFIPNLLYGA